MISPAITFAPISTVGTKDHFFFLSRAYTSIPFEIFAPAILRISSRGRCIPSNMFVIRPGPSSTESSMFVEVTISPGPKPAVSSYT